MVSPLTPESREPDPQEPVGGSQTHLVCTVRWDLNYPRLRLPSTWCVIAIHPRKPGALNRPMKDKVCSCLVCSCLVCSSALLVFFSSFPEFEFNSFSLLLFPFLRGGSCVCFSPPVRCHLNPSFFERRAASEK